MSILVRRGLGCAAVVAALTACWPEPAGAARLAPDSPEVQRTVAKAIKFLESDAGRDERGKVLVGLAMVKYGADAKHPRVAEAVQSIQDRVRNHDPKALGINIYETGLAIIFLVTLDSSKYGPEIENLLAYLQAVQKPHGGWGYPDKETGDTSMTQYAVLSSWEATQAGFRVPRETIENVATWLCKTQDPGGGWGYQGVVSETFTKVKQGTVRPSLGTAGLGSIYIAANLLGLSAKVQRDDDLPKALKEIREKEQLPPGEKLRIEPRHVREAQSSGNTWMRTVYKAEPPKVWGHYYLYALERYWAFRESAEGDKDQTWYVDGARYLIKTQSPDGSWMTGREGMGAVDTAFAVLFLLRSSKKSIERAYNFGSGVLVGGQGLPREMSRVEVNDGQIVSRPTAESARRWLVPLADPGSPDHQHAIDTLRHLPPEEAAALVSADEGKVRTLAERGSPEVRIIALRTLAHTRNLDYVPLLVLALSDANPRIMHTANGSLQYLSRKLIGYELTDHPSPADRQAVIDKWKAWYLSVRPDAAFLN